ncbi:MAG: YceI family protein [Planctomycetota bacterium]
MKRMIAAVSGAAAVLALTGAAVLVPGPVATADVERLDGHEYKVDAVHSSVFFKIKHAGIANFYGRFNELDGVFHIDTENPSESTFSATIPIESIDTNNDRRDGHLKAADFFNMRQFPTATFESTLVNTTDEDGVFELRGDLTLHGRKRPVVATLHDFGTATFRGNDIAAFEARFEIKRADFGMTTYVAEDGSDSGGLGNTVEIVIAVEGIKQ